MATHKIGGSIVLEGDKAYKQALKDIKSAHAELRSEMKLANASFKDNQNSLEALQKKHEILSKQVDVQRDKVKLYEKAVSDSSAAAVKTIHPPIQGLEIPFRHTAERPGFLPTHW